MNDWFPCNEQMQELVGIFDHQVYNMTSNNDFQVLSRGILFLLLSSDFIPWFRGQI